MRTPILLDAPVPHDMFGGYLYTAVRALDDCESPAQRELVLNVIERILADERAHPDRMSAARSTILQHDWKNDAPLKVAAIAVSGIYRLEWDATGDFYIGQAKNIAIRIGQHLSDLNRHVHSNARVQAAYDARGTDGMQFRLLEECDTGLLLHRERAWIHWLNPPLNKAPEKSARMVTRTLYVDGPSDPSTCGSMPSP